MILTKIRFSINSQKWSQNRSEGFVELTIDYNNIVESDNSMIIGLFFAGVVKRFLNSSSNTDPKIICTQRALISSPTIKRLELLRFENILDQHDIISECGNGLIQVCYAVSKHDN